MCNKRSEKSEWVLTPATVDLPPPPEWVKMSDFYLYKGNFGHFLRNFHPTDPQKILTEHVGGGVDFSKKEGIFQNFSYKVSLF